MERRLTELLAECLELMEREGLSIDQVVSRYPDNAVKLKSLLSTAEHLGSFPAAAPRPEFQTAAKTRLFNRIAALPEIAPQPKDVTFAKLSRLKPRKHALLRRFSMSWIMIIAAAASLLLGGGGVVYASADALPGDALYPVKSAWQDVELAFSSDEGDIELLIGFMEENIQAMNQLADQGRWDDLELGLQQYQENLERMLKTRQRISYEDSPADTALLTRIQTELQAQTQLLLQLQERLRDQTQLQDKIQQAIQQTDQGNVFGPNDGGPPDQSGQPNGAGPGEPQGTQVQQEIQTQNQTGQPDESDQPGGPADEGDQGQNSCGQSGSETGEELEEDALCTTPGGDNQGEGKGTGQGGKP